jgi:hypothetical protein
MTHIYTDAVSSCVADVSDFRDLITMRSRVEDEGVSFLTITLPNFARDFEQALSIGYIDSKHFHGFRKCRSIPSFLRGMISRVFDQETGRIYEDSSTAPDPISSYVRVVRQICLAFKKIKLACTPERESRALASFVSTEQSFSTFYLSEEDTTRFARVSFALWSDMLRHILPSMLTPKHGPGATSDRVSGNQKFNWVNWHERLEPYFPIVGNGYSISVDSERMLEGVTFLPADQEIPVRVTLVPKTLKTPRVIAIEPCCMQFAQQGIQSALVDAIESSWCASGHVNFRDQEVNQKLAMTSSSDGLLATVDLSDASDRVPLSLALTMFDSNPDLRDAIEACRSTHAILPDGSMIGPLRKFASMGSALCFPIEAMYFYTLCIDALLRIQNLPVTRRSINFVRQFVHVYGDDIVIPTTYATTILDHLQKYNCRVNHNKTFLTGKFRESCGVDAYNGTDVSPIYVTTPPPKNRQQASELLSWNSLAHQFYLAGFWRSANHCYMVIERIVGRLPYVSFESQCLGRKSLLGYRSIGRWNRRYHSFEVKAWCPTPVYRTDELDGYGALMKSFQRPRERTILPLVTDRDHLLRSALHGEVALKRRWVPVT